MTDEAKGTSSPEPICVSPESTQQAFLHGAECYEVLANADKRLKREGPFLLECLRRAPNKRCVDLACGTGLHALFLAEHGARVDAVDLSLSMVEYARHHRGHESIAYQVGDMRQIEGGPWDLALCLGNSFSLLLTEDDMLSAMTRVRQRLTPGGLLVAQLINYTSAQCREPRHRVERRRLEKAELVAIKNLVPHDIYTLLTLTYFLHPNGGPIHSTSESAVLRNWTYEQFSEMALQAGYGSPELYGSFEGSSFDVDTSPDLIAVLTLPPAA